MCCGGAEDHEVHVCINNKLLGKTSSQALRPLKKKKEQKLNAVKQE